jgi:polar amino acid transport system substrate-binding protein
MPSMPAAVAPPAPDPETVRALAPEGAIRVGINLSNFLLVSGTDENGAPFGVSPSLGAELARTLGVEAKIVSYPDPGDVVEAVAHGMVDVGNVGADPSRAEHVAFTAPYCEIDATFLVPAASSFTTADEVDVPGVRIASRQGAAYTLWLDRNIQRAELVHTNTIEQSFQMFIADRLEALAGLRPRLIEDAGRLAGSRVLDGRFTAVHQAIGVNRARGPEAHAYLDVFVEWAVGSGLIAALIDQYQVEGLSVATPPAARPH